MQGADMADRLTLSLSIALITSFAAAPAAAHQTHKHDKPKPTSALSIDHRIDQKMNEGEASWLAGDHHIHSRFSTGYDTKANPPTPLVGEDAAYPIPMNAVMARRYGLDWMVATDHGGPNHSKVAHDHSYPELQISREAVPDLVQFFGMELNSPSADHSSVIIPAGADEAERLLAIESRFDPKEVYPVDPARNTEAKMIEALKFMNTQSPKPLVIANHPSRSAKGLGEYGLDTPAELRNWNDAAPDIAVGMEGSPGHQAAQQMKQRFASSAHSGFVKERRRGSYGNYPTMGGYDQMTARLGGFWDSMIGEGRKWWITANSDSHIHWSDGGADFWPGEYSKTYVYADKKHASILDGLRKGRVFVTTGDLISALDVTAKVTGGASGAITGGTLIVPKGKTVTITIKFHDPDGKNANGDNPAVARIDLIRGSVTGPVKDRKTDINQSTRVEARFDSSKWRREGSYTVVEYEIKALKKHEYIRVRGTNTDQLEPTADVQDESPWADLWFYSNPLFLKIG
jgi:hypothetical protein